MKIHFRTKVVSAFAFASIFLMSLVPVKAEQPVVEIAPAEEIQEPDPKELEEQKKLLKEGLGFDKNLRTMWADLKGKKYRFKLSMEPADQEYVKNAGLLTKAPKVTKPICFILNCSKPQLKIKCSVPPNTLLYPVFAKFTLLLKYGDSPERTFTARLIAPCEFNKVTITGIAKFDYPPDGRASHGDYWWTGYPADASYTKFFVGVYKEFDAHSKK